MDCRWTYTLSDIRLGMILPSGPWKCFAVKEKWVDLSCYVILHRTSDLLWEVTSRWNSASNCYHSVQSFTPCLVLLNKLTKNLRNKNLLDSLYGFTAWVDILWEEYRLRVSEKDREQQGKVNLFLSLLSTAILKGVTRAPALLVSFTRPYWIHRIKDAIMGWTYRKPGRCDK
jgi:hypothetical protein